MTNNLDSARGTACIITGGLLSNIKAKTAHGLIRQSDRFQIVGVIDSASAGKDAGELLDGIKRNIPVAAQLDQLMEILGEKPEYAIIGMATKGGVLPKELYPLIRHGLELDISIVNGLHESLSDVAEFSDLLKNKPHIHIYDIRKSKPFKDLHFWSGKIQEVDSLKVAVLGTDCALGKRTTSKFLINELRHRKINAHMIYTGQTGWLQGSRYGFIFDSTPNDFISGELEHAVYDCWLNERPEIIIIEGQSSLRNPSGPCGSEFIISAALDGVILQHDPKRTYFNGLENLEKQIGNLADELELIRLLGTETLAIALNTAEMEADEALSAAEKIEAETGRPTILPLIGGIERGVDVLEQRIRQRQE